MTLSDPLSSPTPRFQALRAFAAQALGEEDFELAVASADASFRSYWRSTGNRGTHIVMDAPPEHEDIRPWLDVARRLAVAGVHVPRIVAADAVQGFVLMEDLGARTYLPALNDNSVDRLYRDAFAALLAMQARADTQGLPAYDRDRLITEMELMPTWFLQRHLGIEADADHRLIIERAFHWLPDVAAEQPAAFVHRDFHSRNLLVTDTASPGVIDFQDAVVGPLTYDLVSLLRDCYIEWDDARVEGWVDEYRRRALDAGLIDASVDAGRFRRWFDLMGVQRHIKVLGIFCRLWYRDGKASYLGDLPRVWRYTQRIGSRYPELAELIGLLSGAVGDVDLTVPRSTGAA